MRVTIEVGPLQRKKRTRGKAKKPAANREVKAFLTWVLQQL